MYLYDARYNILQKTTYEKLEGIFDMSHTSLASMKCKKQRLRKRYYIVNDDVTLKERKKYYSSYEIKDETWKEVEGSDGKYLVSDYGRFKRIYKSRPEGVFILPYIKHGKKHQVVKITFKGINSEYLVGRIVAYHFLDIYYIQDSKVRKSKNDKYKYYTHKDVKVYHKNGLAYDNYVGNLEYLDFEDLGKKTAHISRSRSIYAIDTFTGEIIGYYRSARDASKHLPISYQTIYDNLNGKTKNGIAGGRYIFKFDE